MSACYAAGTSYSYGHEVHGVLTTCTKIRGIQFFALPILMVVGRIAYFRPDMTCIIGLKEFS